MKLLHRILEAHPDYPPAIHDYIEATRYQPQLLDTSWSSRSGPSAALRCLAVVTKAPTGYPAAIVPALAALEEQSSSACSAMFLGLYAKDLTPRKFWYPHTIKYLEHATRVAPEVSYLWFRWAGLLTNIGRAAEAPAAVKAGLQHALHASQRLLLYSVQAVSLGQLHGMGRAFEMRRALAAAVERDGRPGLRHTFAAYVDFVQPSDPAVPSWEQRGLEQIRLAVEHRSRYLEWAGRRNLGAALSDAGRPMTALTHLDRAVALADSSGSRLMQTEAYRFRGRTYAKLGRLEEAERDLRRAISLAPGPEDAYYRAEAYHNLAHTYEEMGRLRDGARMIDSFIALTRPMLHAQPRMMSLRDAGIIRRKNSWPAAANAAYEEMVRVVEQQDRGHYYAGEYFEQAGELARARQAYQRGVEQDEGERSLNLGGLARTFEKLGQLDSAEAAARAHDSVMSNQLDVPLLPPILAAEGRGEEAVKLSRAWARKQLLQGNLQGATLAALGLAELLLEHGDPGQALSEAIQAESLARRINLTDELIQARRVKGLSRLRLGEPGGLDELRSAAELAEAHPTTEGVLLTQLALAQGLAGAGHGKPALAAFDRSARIIERTTRRLELDLDRARFRGHQLAAFDGAMELLLREPESAERLAALLNWSQRRKATSLALAAGVQDGEAAGKTLSLATLRGRIPPGSALLDYLLIRDRAAVLVVSDKGAELVSLPGSPDTLSRLVEQLRAPLVRSYAGQIDLARARFDLTAARALYAALLAPVERQLAGVSRLLIVPDGPLHYVPFDALVREAIASEDSETESAPAFAIDRFQIELLPSAQFLPSPPQRPQAPLGRVLVLAHDAPGWREEARAIQQAWPSGSVTVLEGTAATEAGLRSAGEEPAILHFATHAQANDREPASSHLRLAAAGADDGFLHLGEIAAQRRRTRLVVLSACETLSGRLYHGEGLMGLARAFLSSGASAVVATQWPVGAASGALMGEFHNRLAEGIEPARALWEAKDILRKRPETAHPFYWAGFALLRGKS